MFNARDDVIQRQPDVPGTWELLSRDRATMATGKLLLGAVILLVLVDVVVRLGYRLEGAASNLAHKIYINISIGRDNSLAETVNHGMAFSAAILFFTAAVASGSRTCLALSGFMGIAWLDDSLQYHERVGKLFGSYFPKIGAFGVGAVHIGELVAWSTIGIVLLALTIWASRQLTHGDHIVLRMVSLPILLLVFCAAIVDLVHVALSATMLDAALMYLEDGGEMVAIAMLATIAMYLVRNCATVFARF